MERLAGAFDEMGVECHKPEGTFYMTIRSPIDDDVAFSNMLMEERVFCLPGSVMDLPGHLRITLTANDDMVERAIPRFRRAVSRARGQ
jgi:aspartate aminotransferase